MLRSLVASATTTALLATGCTADRPWPRQPVAVTTQAFAHHAEITTIDVLPLDLQMWGEAGYDGDLDSVRGKAEVNIMNVALEALAKRNFAVGAMIDWNGDYPGGTALSKNDLIATVGSLAHYGAAAAEHPGALPVPFLPARLGNTTGADATLYVGGWSYVAKHHDGVGDKIVEGIVIGLLVLTVIAVVAAVTRSSKGSSHGGGGGGGGSSGGGGGGGAPHGGFSAARGVGHVHGQGALFRTPSATEQIVDAFGRAAVEVALTTADWGEDPELPHSGAESQMYLEMTLIDNHTGLALWHARQKFPASAASSSETTRVARTMLGQLPGRDVQTATATN